MTTDNPLPLDVLQKYLEIIGMTGDEFEEYRGLMGKKSMTALTWTEKGRLHDLMEKLKS